MNNKNLITHIKSRCNRNLEGIVSKVILFGSRADGNAGLHSDYDILVITNKEIDWKVKDMIRNIISDIALENDIVIDAHLISEPELNTIKGKQIFIQKALQSELVA